MTLSLLLAAAAAADPLPGTRPLTADGDLAAAMVAGIDRYLTAETLASRDRRPRLWTPDTSSAEAFRASVEPNRRRLRKALGVVDRRVPFADVEFVGGRAPVAETDAYAVFAVRWPVLPGVDGEGLLLEPKAKPVACVVALPHSGWTPEDFVGLSRTAEPGPFHEAPRVLAENGCRVVVPALIDRDSGLSANPRIGRRTNIPHREFVYRAAYEMGRHVVGYEVQTALAVVDWFARGDGRPPVFVWGHGEGGRIALYAGALDDRVTVTVVGGYFGRREGVCREPIDRNVWGLLREFGDVELGQLFAFGRHLVVVPEPRVRVRQPVAAAGRSGAAPGGWESPPREEARAERERVPLLDGGKPGVRPPLYVQDAPFAAEDIFDALFGRPGGKSRWKSLSTRPTDRRADFDPAARHKRLFDQLVGHAQTLWRDSDAVRRDFWKKADASSPEAWRASCGWYRDYFHEEVIGKLPPASLPPNPRSRRVYDEPKWAGYEVVLNVHTDVFASGVLLLPKGQKPGERRPAVVCQHGLEGTPRSCIDPEPRPTYNRFAVQLVERGYVVYCPQNPYRGGNAFRELQRKANPLKLSLFSFVVRQHEVTLDWLATLPEIDPDRIAFYGLSYGGKTAMRVPALLPRYCLSICSGDFNEWVGKNVSVDLPASYLYTGEYEMPEFDLGHTFNYAEMAGLIAPRPFMVERGRGDPVGTDEMVAAEYDKVRRLYDRLKLPDRTEIEFFDGGHAVNGKGTFAFLARHLDWPR